MLNYSNVNKLLQPIFFIAFTRKPKKTKNENSQTGKCQHCNIFVIKHCQGNMHSREVVSKSHIYLSEPMWPHTLTHLAPEIN